MTVRELPILFLDDDLVAINKPSGLLVHRSEIDRHETEFAVQIVRDQIGKKVFPVHRLDRPTSGVLVFALNSDCARILCADFAERSVRKQYTAIVRGFVSAPQEIDHAMKAEPAYKLGRLADVSIEPQPALTRVEPGERFVLPHAVGRYETCRFSKINMLPKTGRRHQLRRHAAHISHPIIGDTTHGDGRYNRFVRSHFRIHRLLLVAESLSFTHPSTNEPITINADCGDEFDSVLERLRAETMDASD